jgi:ACS family hexuronate transporter-like MFS transporter
VIHHYGWQTTFVATGALGFVWLAPVDRVPSAGTPSLDDGEGARPDPELETTAARDFDSRLSFRYRQVWAIVMGGTLVDPIWWLYSLAPEYLNKVGFSMTKIGLFA